MGSLFKRGDSRFWWVGFTDATGKRKNVSTGTEDEKTARTLLEKIERRVAAELAAGGGEKPLTVERYAVKTWLPTRRARGLRSVDKDEDCLAHAYPVVGHLKLEDVRPSHLKTLMGVLERAEKPLAPRSRIAVYRTLQTLFSDAVSDELIQATPAILRERRGELPPKRDKDPMWRLGAVYTRDEAESLMSDPRIPEWRRVLWALAFLTGSRINEVTPRRWRDYDPNTKPLGRLTLATHWDMKEKLERPATKTDVVREAPVHPTLAAVLAAWKLSGWEAYQGRQPGPEDLVVPSPYKRQPGNPAGAFLNSNASLRRLKADCQLLGIRARDQHSMRRTFISLGIADGALEPVLRRVTHEGQSKVMDLYKVLPWSALCAEVSKLQLVVRRGSVVRLAAGATAMLRHSEVDEMTKELSGRGGTRTRYLPPSIKTVGTWSRQISAPWPESVVTQTRDAPDDRSTSATSDPPTEVPGGGGQ